jgi:inosine-uridine nucleoside N-ribohydrolase
MRPLIIITDAAPSGDDAAALVMLIAANADIKLIVATSGNVWADESAKNVRTLLGRLRRDDIEVCVDVPSAAVAARQAVIARGGTASRHYTGAYSSEPPQPPRDFSACGDLFPLIAAAGRPDLFVIGPVSPLVPLLERNPDLADRIGTVYVMGGTLRDHDGKIAPTAEFNFWFDPEAAETLLASGLAITLMPLDLVADLHYSAEFAARLDAASPLAPHVRNSVAHPDSITVCDEVLAAVVLDPRLVLQRRALKLSVDTSPGPGHGVVTILDDRAERRAVDVIERIDEAAFWRAAGRAFASQPAGAP